MPGKRQRCSLLSYCLAIPAQHQIPVPSPQNQNAGDNTVFFFSLLTRDEVLVVSVKAELSRGALSSSLWPGCDYHETGIVSEECVGWDGCSSHLMELESTFLGANKGKATPSVRAVGAVHKCSSPGGQKQDCAGSKIVDLKSRNTALPRWWAVPPPAQVVLYAQAGYLQFLCKRRTKAIVWSFSAVWEHL